MQIEDYLLNLIQKAVGTLSSTGVTGMNTLRLERPLDVAFGEFSTNVALVTFGKLKKEQPDFSFSSSREFSVAIVTELQKLVATTEHTNWINSITTAGPGFINFSLSDQYYLELLPQLLSSQEEFLNASKPVGSLILEYMQPNTNKPLHIGHLRNAALGRAMGNILKRDGWQVKLATINNDRGLHIIKSMWGYLGFGFREKTNTVDPLLNWQEALQKWKVEPELWMQPTDMLETRLQKPDHFVGYWYQQADTFAEDSEVQTVWANMLKAWEDSSDQSHTTVRSLWKQMNDWFYAGYAQTAKVLDVVFDADQISYESEIYEKGKQVILAGVEQGVFKKLEDGAVKAELEQFKLPDKILLRRDGTGIYMTFDIELTRQRSLKKVDRLVWVVGSDQQLYFQQLFAIAELLGYGNRGKFFHFSYGMVRLPEGKMSSRKGLVVYGDDLLFMAQEKARSIMQSSGVASNFSPEEFEHIVQAVGVGAVKWTMLGQDPQSELIFNIEESVNFTGFAGPYVQYTAARAQSVLTKAQISTIAIPFDKLLASKEYSSYQLNSKERDILVMLSKYFDILQRSAQEHAPHHLCVYLFGLAQSFNSLYADQKIITTDHTEAIQMSLRLALTQAVRQVLADGLTLLGIEAVERM